MNIVKKCIEEDIKALRKELETNHNLTFEARTFIRGRIDGLKASLMYLENAMK